jgi:hypothetical protein
MLAMDVVDTLRHSRRLVEKELASEENDAQLLRRLRDIYASQGIEVPDEILRQGVAALKEQRFVYKPPPPGFWTSIAWLYVTRKRWRAKLIVYALLIVVAWHWDSFGIQTKIRSLIDWPATESTEAIETTKPVEPKSPFETKSPVEIEGLSPERQDLVDEITVVLQRIYALGPKDAVMTRARTLHESCGSMVEVIDERENQRSVKLSLDGISLSLIVTRWDVGRLEPEYLIPVLEDTITEW